MPKIPPQIQQKLLKVAQELLERLEHSRSIGFANADPTPEWIEKAPEMVQRTLGNPPTFAHRPRFVLARKDIDPSLPLSQVGETLGEPRVLGEPMQDIPVEGPVFDAYQAMDRVLRKTMKRFSPTVFAPIRGGQRPDKVGFAESKPGMSLPADRGANVEDLVNEVASRMLKEARRFPHKTPQEMANAIESPVARWAYNVSEAVRTPKDVIDAQLLLKQAGKVRGRDPKDPALFEAREYLESRGATRPVRSVEHDLSTPDRAPSPEEAYIQATDPDLPTKRVGTLNPLETSQALQRLQEALNDPKILTEKQKRLLVLRYGLDDTRSGVESGAMSQSAVAKALGQKLSTVQEAEAGALKKIFKHLGVKPAAKPEVQGPPMLIRPRGKSSVQYGDENPNVRLPSEQFQIFTDDPGLQVQEYARIPAGLQYNWTAQASNPKDALRGRVPSSIRVFPSSSIPERIVPVGPRQRAGVQYTQEALPRKKAPPEKPTAKPVARKLRPGELREIRLKETTHSGEARLVPDPNGPIAILVQPGADPRVQGPPVLMRFRRVPGHLEYPTGTGRGRRRNLRKFVEEETK